MEKGEWRENPPNKLSADKGGAGRVGRVFEEGVMECTEPARGADED